MNGDDLEFLIGCDDMGKRSTVYPKIGMGAAIVRLVRMVREQDKRARHAEAERDAFNTRIGELEEQLRRCKEHKERNDAISFRVQNTRERQIAELNKMVDDRDEELAVLRSRAGVCER